MRIIKDMSVKPRGFTIVELLIVIVIIAILAAITVVAFRGIQERANSTAIISQAKAYIKGLTLWEAELGRPTTNSCITPSTYTTCVSAQHWGANQPVDSTFMVTLNQYAGINEMSLGKFTGSTPVGAMWYHSNYFGDNRGVLHYNVGPNTDCGLPKVLSPNPGFDNMTLLGNPYTSRSAQSTSCMLEVFKW